MRFEFDDAVKILARTPSVMEEQLSGLKHEWLSGNEGEGTWNPAEIICHMIHCEVDDWVPRMKIILSEDENKKFKPFDRTFGFEKSKREPIDELLKEFKEHRERNLKYLKSAGVSEELLRRKGIHPDFGEVTLKQLLATWAVHDLSHIAQISRILAKQYSDEVGPWKEYLNILNR